MTTWEQPQGKLTAQATDGGCPGPHSPPRRCGSRRQRAGTGEKVSRDNSCHQEHSAQGPSEPPPQRSPGQGRQARAGGSSAAPASRAGSCSAAVTHPPSAHQLQVTRGPVAMQHGALRRGVAQAQSFRVGSEGCAVIPRLEQRVTPRPKLLRRHLPTDTGWDAALGPARAAAQGWTQDRDPRGQGPPGTGTPGTGTRPSRSRPSLLTGSSIAPRP